MHAYTNAYKHATKISEKRDHVFEGEWGGIYKRFGRKKRERCNYITIPT